MNWRKPTHPTIPPPCRDATCCVGDSMGLRIKSARTQAHFDTPAMVFLLLALRRIVSLRGGGVKVRSKVVR